MIDQTQGYANLCTRQTSDFDVHGTLLSEMITTSFPHPKQIKPYHAVKAPSARNVCVHGFDLLI